MELNPLYPHVLGIDGVKVIESVTITSGVRILYSVCMAGSCTAVGDYTYRRVRIISSWASALTSAQKRGWAYNTYFHAIGCSISPPTHQVFT